MKSNDGLQDIYQSMTTNYALPYYGAVAYRQPQSDKTVSVPQKRAAEKSSLEILVTSPQSCLPGQRSARRRRLRLIESHMAKETNKPCGRRKQVLEMKCKQSVTKAWTGSQASSSRHHGLPRFEPCTSSSDHVSLVHSEPGLACVS